MNRRKMPIFGMVLLAGLMLTGCAWFHGDASNYHELGSGFGYYGYPPYQEYGEYPVFDEHHHHHR